MMADGRSVSLAGDAGNSQQSGHHGGCHRGEAAAPNQEIASRLAFLNASSSVKGPIAMELKNSYGQFAELHLSESGIVR